VLDFTSALYLGLKHPTRTLPPWQQFTTGAPAALVVAADARAISQDLAVLMGCEAATLGTSTFHLVWDLFGLLAKSPVTLYMDAEVYPITRWGIQRAAQCGVAVKTFPHHDPTALRRELTAAPRGHTPVIVTDGFCPGCGRVAPLREYQELANQWGGLVVADDTQALGILGQRPGRTNPYGGGGGGSFPWSNAGGNNIIVMASLAKAFGVPVAVLGGSRSWVGHFNANAETRVHCSPPSIPTLLAARHALRINHEWGDVLRLRLRRLIQTFREKLRTLGVGASGGLFPTQTLQPAPDGDAIALHENLARHGMRTVLQRGSTGGGAQVTLLLSASHSFEEIETAAAMIGQALHKTERTFRRIDHQSILQTNTPPDVIKRTGQPEKSR